MLDGVFADHLETRYASQKRPGFDIHLARGIYAEYLIDIGRNLIKSLQIFSRIFSQSGEWCYVDGVVLYIFIPFRQIFISAVKRVPDCVIE